MNRKTQYYFDLATKIANAKDDKRSFKVGVIAQRRDGVFVGSANGPVPYPTPQAHAEARVVRKLDHNSVLWVVRILRLDGSFAMSSPCDDCRKIIRRKKVVKVYYSISPNEYGVWYPLTDDEYQVGGND